MPGYGLLPNSHLKRSARRIAFVFLRIGFRFAEFRMILVVDLLLELRTLIVQVWDQLRESDELIGLIQLPEFFRPKAFAEFVFDFPQIRVDPQQCLVLRVIFRHADHLRKTQRDFVPLDLDPSSLRNRQSLFFDRENRETIHRFTDPDLNLQEFRAASVMRALSPTIAIDAHNILQVRLQALIRGLVGSFWDSHPTIRTRRIASVQRLQRRARVVVPVPSIVPI